MKQQWTKRILAGVATLALALPIAFGLGQHTVHADETDPAPTVTTQKVVLTKYGFTTEKLPAAADRDTNVKPEDSTWAADAEALPGVKFEVYDVTDNYWENPGTFSSTNLPTYAGDPVATGTTDDHGQITFALSTQTGDHNAIYIFHEAQPRTGYVANVSENFMLSLPATANADGNVYVYPKNEQKAIHKREFTKVDGETTKPVQGAGFVITNADGTKFLQLIDVDGDPAEVKAGFVDALNENFRFNWLDTETGATIFTSDKDGLFGLNGFDDATTDYQAIETVIPDGYEKAADTKFLADGTKTDIKDMPKHLLPHTGGAGILAILAVGSALIALAFVGIRKRQARA